MVSQRKSNASPINLWNKILGQFKLRVFTTENIYGSRVIYDVWTCSCIDEYKRELRQHLKLWRKFASFPPVQTPKMILDFTVIIFQKEKHFIVRKRAMNFLTTTLPLRAYLFTFNVFVTVVIYVQNGFSVGSYSLKCFYFSWNKSFKLWKENILTYLTFLATDPNPLLPLAKRDCMTKNRWDPGYTENKDTILKKKLTRHLL